MNELTTKVIPTQQSAEIVHQSPSRELSLKHGIYDLLVSVFRQGAFYETYLSQVRVGDSFCFEKRDKDWFLCVTPIKNMCTSRGDMDNPTFLLGALEVLQAKPIAIEYPAPEVPKLESSKPKLEFEDVEFKSST